MQSLDTINDDECFYCGTRIACRDSFGHVLLPGLWHCSSACTRATMRAFNLCIGCDGEHTADGPDGWCPECRNIARVEGIPPSAVDVAWIDDQDGCGPRRLQSSIRCF